MPVFDFNNTPEENTASGCTYTIFQSSEPAASPEKLMAGGGETG